MKIKLINEAFDKQYGVKEERKEKITRSRAHKINEATVEDFYEYQEEHDDYHPDIYAYTDALYDEADRQGLENFVFEASGQAGDYTDEIMFDRDGTTMAYYIDTDKVYGVIADLGPEKAAKKVLANAIKYAGDIGEVSIYDKFEFDEGLTGTIANIAGGGLVTDFSKKKIKELPEEKTLRREPYYSDSSYTYKKLGANSDIPLYDLISIEFGKQFPNLNGVSYFNYYDKKDGRLKGVSIDDIPPRCMYVAKHTNGELYDEYPTYYIRIEDYDDFVDFVRQYSKPVEDNVKFAIDMVEDAVEKYTNAKVIDTKFVKDKLIITIQDDDGKVYSANLIAYMKNYSGFRANEFNESDLSTLLREYRVSGNIEDYWRFARKYHLDDNFPSIAKRIAGDLKRREKDSGVSLPEDLGKDLDKYQEWIDYDMKRYGKISAETNREIREAGLRIVKDKYGDYEVIA